jgi:hypothetical protein
MFVCRLCLFLSPSFSEVEAATRSEGGKKTEGKQKEKIHFTFPRIEGSQNL